MGGPDGVKEGRGADTSRLRGRPAPPKWPRRGLPEGRGLLWCGPSGSRAQGPSRRILVTARDKARRLERGFCTSFPACSQVPAGALRRSRIREQFLEVGGPEGALRPAARPSCGRGGHMQSGEVPCLSGEAHAESSRPPGVPRGGPEASGPQIRDACFTRHPDRSRRVFLSLPAACPPEGSKVRAQPTVGPRKQEVGARPGPCLWPQKDQWFPRLPAPRASRDTVTP